MNYNCSYKSSFLNIHLFIYLSKFSINHLTQVILAIRVALKVQKLDGPLLLTLQLNNQRTVEVDSKQMKILKFPMLTISLISKDGYFLLIEIILFCCREN